MSGAGSTSNDILPSTDASQPLIDVPRGFVVGDERNIARGKLRNRQVLDHATEGLQMVITLREKSVVLLPPYATKDDKKDKGVGFEALMSEFFESCNRSTVHKTVAIVKVTGSDKGVKKATMGCYSVKKHAEMNFIDWWKKDYLEGKEPDGIRREIMMYINYTPCIKCAKKLREWLSQYKNVKLTIRFSYVYTKTLPTTLTIWEKKRSYIDKVITELRYKHDNGSTLKMQKIDQATLEELLREFNNEIEFEGFPKYANYEWENEICGNEQEPRENDEEIVETRDNDEETDTESESESVAESESAAE